MKNLVKSHPKLPRFPCGIAPGYGQCGGLAFQNIGPKTPMIATD